MNSKLLKDSDKFRFDKQIYSMYMIFTIYSKLAIACDWFRIDILYIFIFLFIENL